MIQLLLVEDDERISEPLVRLLRSEGFVVHHAGDGAGALAHARGNDVDLVLLDLTLPDVDGLDVCRALRAERPTLPIVMLTARNQEVDVVVGLGAGADDYVTKPFRVGELVARIRARLRAADAAPAPAPAAAAEPGAATTETGDAPSAALSVRDVRVDPAARRAWRGEHELTLTPKEFDLLEHLVRHAGTTLRREDIMRDVWDEHWWGSTRTLDTHVAALRRKLGDDDGAGDGRLITTLRGVGLRFETG